MSIFTRQGSSRLGPAAGGIACGNSTVMVIELAESELHFGSTYYRGRGLSVSSIQTELSASAKWYGIVDGNIRHEAILVLMETHESWKNFRWLVTLVRPGIPIERYRQHARNQN